ncbi:hypothetical protein JVT61DRAFT_4028 [Boletus reticuloceps]|uniref:Uncharacterized protein n=1 Tax=Boletus reticuloceps TaxID=495285 RepID=A0A8I2YPF9_9AGAM|nr:hypothetical protein JVT61DRAFT_4028 [Boletus reticuloceps]
MPSFPSYSPLFTLGLLAEHNPKSSRSSPPSPVDDVSAIYFTLKKGKRDTTELRSFLYLDLADNTRHAPSHRRKFSILSKSTSWTCTADVHDFTRTEKPMITSPAPVLSTRRRTSRDSLRSIPSPKPAPSATLPELPTASHLRPPPSSTSLLKKRPASTVITSPLSLTPRLRRSASSRSESISSHDRRRSRLDALACLEGRSRAPNRVLHSSSLRNNFMSFSDDEDEKSIMRRPTVPAPPAIQVEDLSAFADVEDEVDAIIPNVRKRDSSNKAKPARPTKPTRKRRGTIESWFPLKSFIDFKDDDSSSWNWRSFIEIGGVS